MDNGLLVAIISGLCGMVGWGTADFFAKKTIDSIGDLRTLFWGQAIGIVPLLMLFMIHPEVPATTSVNVLQLVGFGMVTAISYLFLYDGFGRGEVSLLSPIFASYSVVVVLLAAIFLGAGLSFVQAVAIAFVAIGILLLSTDPRELRNYLKSKSGRIQGVPQVLSAMLMYSFWLLFFDTFLNDKPWVFYLLVIRIVTVISLLVYGTLTHKPLAVANRSLWKPLAVIGVFDVGAFGAISYGFSHTTHIGIVTVLSATFSIPTIVLAYVFLHERITRLQIAAIATVLLGVVLVTMS